MPGCEATGSPALCVCTALSRQLNLVEGALDPTVPQEVRRERIAAVIMLLTATLADRAGGSAVDGG